MSLADLSLLQPLTAAEELSFEKLMRHFVTISIVERIDHSCRFSDSLNEFRIVSLPRDHPLLQLNIFESFHTRFFSEPQWRLLGIRQSRGWVHVGYSPFEPHVLLYRRPKYGNEKQNQLRLEELNNLRNKFQWRYSSEYPFFADCDLSMGQSAGRRSDTGISGRTVRETSRYPTLNDGKLSNDLVSSSGSNRPAYLSKKKAVEMPARASFEETLTSESLSSDSELDVERFDWPVRQVEPLTYQNTYIDHNSGLVKEKLFISDGACPTVECEDRFLANCQINNGDLEHRMDDAKNAVQRTPLSSEAEQEEEAERVGLVNNYDEKIISPPPSEYLLCNDAKSLPYLGERNIMRRRNMSLVYDEHANFENVKRCRRSTNPES